MTLEEIEALRAEVARLTKDRDEWKATADALQDDDRARVLLGGYFTQRLTDAEAEVARLSGLLTDEMESRGQAEQEAASLRDDNARLTARVGALRTALIYLADAVADEVQPDDRSPLGQHLLNARAAAGAPPEDGR